MNHSTKNYLRLVGYLIPFGFIGLLFLIGELLAPKGISKINFFKLLFFVGSFILLSQCISNIVSKRMRRVTQIGYYCLTLLLLILPLIFLIYYLNFGQRIDEYSIMAVFQTDQAEAAAFIQTNFSTQLLLSPLFIFLVPIVLLYSSRKINQLVPFSPKYTWVSFLLFTVALVLCHNTRMVKTTYGNLVTYQEEIGDFRLLNEKIKTNQTKISGIKTAQGETYVVIIGESLNKTHMSLYGYPRLTTPLLDSIHRADSLLVFQNIYANHVHTVPVLVKSLTAANQYNQMDFTAAPSIINILNAANFETYWISNQVKYGPFDNSISVIAENADYKFYYNKNIGRTTNINEFDDVVLPKVKEILTQKSNNNRVLFVHLMGNHFKYDSRYPSNFKKYQPPLAPALFGKEKPWKVQENICGYDNSILFNDQVVGTIYRYVKQSSNGVKGLLYFSDHGDDVIGDLQHNASKFTFSMAQIPFVLWFSDAYKKKYAKQYERLKSKEKTHWSNDLVHDLLLGIMDVQSEAYEAKYDLCNAAYDLPTEKLRVINGVRKYTSKRNYYFVEQKNSSSLDQYFLKQKYLPHRVNSIGKLKDIEKRGFHNFEIDVLFKTLTDSTGFFEVGHDRTSNSGLKLSDFLKELTLTKPAKIWLDFKNLKSNNLNSAIQELERLSRLFPIKKQLIVESGTTMDAFAQLAAAGYQTSYYLPTTIQEITDKVILEEKAVAIAAQIQRQQVKAVSFDIRLYPWVKHYLEAKIPEAVVYHTWDLPLNFHKIDFYNTLRKRAYAEDDRIKTILFTFPSVFNL